MRFNVYVGISMTLVGGAGLFISIYINSKVIGYMQIAALWALIIGILMLMGVIADLGITYRKNGFLKASSLKLILSAENDNQRLFAKKAKKTVKMV